MHTLPLAISRQGVGRSCPVQIWVGDVLTSPVVFFGQGEAVLYLNHRQKTPVCILSLVNESSAHKGVVVCIAVVKAQCSGVGGKEVINGGGQNAVGSLPSLTTACELNPALCVGSV